MLKTNAVAELLLNSHHGTVINFRRGSNQNCYISLYEQLKSKYVYQFKLITLTFKPVTRLRIAKV